MQLAPAHDHFMARDFARQHLDRAIDLVQGSIPRTSAGDGGYIVNPAPIGTSAARMARQAIELLAPHHDIAGVSQSAARARDGVGLFERFASTHTGGTMYLGQDYAAHIEEYLMGLEALIDARIALI
jgi:hypothetical protein